MGQPAPAPAQLPDVGHSGARRSAPLCHVRIEPINGIRLKDTTDDGSGAVGLARATHVTQILRCHRSTADSSCWEVAFADSHDEEFGKDNVDEAAS